MSMKKHGVVAGGAVFMLALVLTAAAQTEKPVRWLTISQAEELNKKEKRKFLVDVYTDWCGWCKVMDKQTFTDPVIAQMLNEKFYPVKLDAEQTGEITFNGRVYRHLPNNGRGHHELAVTLLSGKMGYPSFVVIDEDFSSYGVAAGYQQPPEFHKFLTFFFENHHKRGDQARAEFERTYRSPYPLRQSPPGEVTGKQE